MLECEPDELLTELRKIVQSEAKNHIPPIRKKKTSICLSAKYADCKGTEENERCREHTINKEIECEFPTSS